ncbi:MAG: type II toxin-antitoxin system VapC family toxin [Patescibacteria group bacterium]
MDENIKHIFVVDASYILAFLLKENNFEVNEMMKQYKVRQINLISTKLLKFEVCNTLRTAVLRKRINTFQVQKLLQAFLDFDIVEEKVDYLQVLKLSLSKNLTFYDASYLYLARSNHIPLLTLDHSLK